MRLLATFGCLLAFGTAAQAAPNDLGVDYSLAPVMDHGALAAMEVRMSFAADADGETQLTLPTEWGGGEKLWISHAADVPQIGDNLHRVHDIR